MDEQVAKNYVFGIVFGAVFVGLGIGVVLASVPFLVFNNFDGLVIIMIGMVVMYILLQKVLKAGYRVKVIKEMKR